MKAAQVVTSPFYYAMGNSFLKSALSDTGAEFPIVSSCLRNRKNIMPFEVRVLITSSDQNHIITVNLVDKL